MLTITMEVQGLESILYAIDFIPANGVWCGADHDASGFTVSQIFKSF